MDVNSYHKTRSDNILTNNTRSDKISSTKQQSIQAFPITANVYRSIQGSGNAIDLIKQLHTTSIKQHSAIQKKTQQTHRRSRSKTFTENKTINQWIREIDGNHEPECRVQGSTAPSKHFRPGYRPVQCGSRCTPSYLLSFLERESNLNLRREERGRLREKERRPEAYTKTSLDEKFVRQ